MPVLIPVVLTAVAAIYNKSVESALEKGVAVVIAVAKREGKWLRDVKITDWDSRPKETAYEAKQGEGQRVRETTAARQGDGDLSSDLQTHVAGGQLRFDLATGDEDHSDGQ